MEKDDSPSDSLSRRPLHRSKRHRSQPVYELLPTKKPTYDGIESRESRERTLTFLEAFHCLGTSSANDVEEVRASRTAISQGPGLILVLYSPGLLAR
jgi:hypothetical protein